LVFIFSIGFLAQKFFEVNRQRESIQKQQVATELHLLKSQINPHFLFNVLNSIYSLSLKKSDETPGVVLKLADILRYMLYETQHDFVPLKKEIQVLQDYLDIEKIRATSRQNMQFVLQGDPELFSIAPALLIPFVENAVKHGTSSMMSQSFIHIHVRIENDALFFNCKNNFRPQTLPETTGGIGLENVRKRLQLIYPNTHALEIKMEQGIFEVQLKIDLKK
jgi:LytS/YehU family sensor histidine kinase